MIALKIFKAYKNVIWEKFYSLDQMINSRDYSSISLMNVAFVSQTSAREFPKWLSTIQYVRYRGMLLLLEELTSNNHSSDLTSSCTNLVEFGISQETTSGIFIYITIPT